MATPPPAACPEAPHAREAAALLAALEACEAGLTEAQAEARRARWGENLLPAARPRPAVLRLLAQVHNLLIYVLLAAAAVTAALAHWIDTGVILAVVAVNAVVGFVQEGRAEQAMAAIRGLLAPRATVLRDGRRAGVAARALVPGDIVLLEPGDRVPADLRLLAAPGLRIEEAILTGESVPADKTTAPVAADAPLGDRRSMAYSGTLVVAGTGRGLVVATGTATEVGRISGLLGSVETLRTPLVAQMDLFARWLTALVLLVAAALLGWGWVVGQVPFDEMFMVVVGLAVAAIPEGLPAVLTITLAVGVQAMARRNAIVRRLPAIETVGAVSVICSDKTGTLTLGQMPVAEVAVPVARYAVAGAGYAPEGEVTAEGAAAPDALSALARAAALCNDAALVAAPDGWRVEGDPMEGALLAFAAKAGAEAEGWARRDEIPFDAAYRYMAVTVEGPEGARLLVKGAPEQVLALCGGAQTGAWLEEAHRIAARGRRVLAFAEAAAPEGALSHESLRDGLCCLGLAGLVDPPRPEAVEAVAACRSAGIAVKMITGDHAATAAAIGAEIGLERPGAVLTGAELDQLSEAELAEAMLHTDIFARTSPGHKLRLVMALQAHGLTVAMTGDGVNDAPALRRADAGIAMGRKGSDAAREASDLVLADDNFASIAAAVREGRRVQDNIRKVVGWTLPTNAGEAATIVGAVLLGCALPVTPVQILWINLVPAVTLGLALAFEPAEPGTMRRPPRPRDAPLVGGN